MKLGKVNGPDASDIWKFMKSETGAPDPTWNFNGKFLISKDGKGKLYLYKLKWNHAYCKMILTNSYCSRDNTVSVPSDLENDIASLM
mmetsp:Transcript_29101/g.70276  ORF Transcript_29101/g.70276 Transcript_29101/m.70276 type:complete len:87 (-) Transcript_29101:150-410(-)